MKIDTGAIVVQEAIALQLDVGDLSVDWRRHVILYRRDELSLL